MQNIKEFRFKGCKNLEFDKKNYPSCRRIPIPGNPTYLCWERPDPHPRLCQYCKIGRRRINKYFSCLDKYSFDGHTKCTRYEEIEHIVSVPISEIQPPLSRVDKHKIKNYLTNEIKNYDSLEIIGELGLKIDVIDFIEDFLKSLTVKELL
jgi:hypothetical protein